METDMDEETIHNQTNNSSGEKPELKKSAFEGAPVGRVSFATENKTTSVPVSLIPPQESGVAKVVQTEKTETFAKESPRSFVFPGYELTPRVATPMYAQKISTSVNTSSITKSTQTEKSDPLDQRPVILPLRTYKDDIARAIRDRNVSLISAVAAESERKKESPTPPVPVRSWRRIAIIGASGLLVLAGVASLVYVLVRAVSPNIGTPALPTSEYIFVNGQTTIAESEFTKENLLTRVGSAVEAISLPLGSIEEVVLREENAEGSGTMTASRLLTVIEARTPDSLTRSLRPLFMVGGHVFDGNQPFLIFKTDSYEQAFAGVLSWEPYLSGDLSPLFGHAIATRVVGTTTTAIASPFEDAVVRNKDVRVLRGEDGKIALLYGFPNRETLVITTNEYTFIEIVTRMTSVRFTQ